MPRRTKTRITNKMRRLVERAINLQIKKTTTIFLPVNGDWSRVAIDRDALHRSARIAKQKLIAEIGSLEDVLAAHRDMHRRSARQ